MCWAVHSSWCGSGKREHNQKGGTNKSRKVPNTTDIVGRVLGSPLQQPSIKTRNLPASTGWVGCPSWFPAITLDQTSENDCGKNGNGVLPVRTCMEVEGVGNLAGYIGIYDPPEALPSRKRKHQLPCWVFARPQISLVRSIAGSGSIFAEGVGAHLWRAGQPYRSP